MERDRGVFRGEPAPASLKHRARAQGEDGMAGIPGRTCPGLIEAMQPCNSGSVNASRYSGANLPRPH